MHFKHCKDWEISRHLWDIPIESALVLLNFPVKLPSFCSHWSLLGKWLCINQKAHKVFLVKSKYWLHTWSLHDSGAIVTCLQLLLEEVFEEHCSPKHACLPCYVILAWALSTCLMRTRPVGLPWSCNCCLLMHCFQPQHLIHLHALEASSGLTCHLCTDYGIHLH